MLPSRTLLVDSFLKTMPSHAKSISVQLAGYAGLYQSDIQTCVEPTGAIFGYFWSILVQSDVQPEEQATKLEADLENAKAQQPLPCHKPFPSSPKLSVAILINS